MRKLQRLAAALIVLCLAGASANCETATGKKAPSRTGQPRKAGTAKKPAPAAKKASGAAKAPAGPALVADQQFYKDEGAHFELPYEQWVVGGILRTPAGEPVFYTGMFHKTGSMYMQVRNGYNTLRLPDGGYDYRTYGQGLFRTLVSNMLKERADKYPENKEYAELAKKLETGDTEHFRTLEENNYPLYRGHLFMNFGGNLFERVSKDKFNYKLELKTWAGPLKLTLKSAADPIYFDAKNPMIVMSGPGKDGYIGMIQGYAFSRLRTDGTLETGGKKTGVSGLSWYEHWMGQPDGKAMSKIVMIGLRLSNGGDMFAAFFYAAGGKLTNTHMLIRKPGAARAAYTKSAHISPIKHWSSPVSHTDYEIAWKLSGGIKGEVTPEPGMENSEIMADQGVGAFWLGPCRFKGSIPGMGDVTGEGICRSVSPVEKK
jgi:predicted secreted hydrolase